MALHFDHGKWNNNSQLYFKIGLIISVLFYIILFQTEIVSAPIDPPIEYAPEDLGIITPPPTEHKKKKVPPVKPPEPIEKIEKILDEPEFIETEPEPEPTESVLKNENQDDLLSNYVAPVLPEAKAPAPEISEPEDHHIYNFAEGMPAFEECMDFDEERDRRNCTDKQLLDLIYNNLRYPPFA